MPNITQDDSLPSFRTIRSAASSSRRRSNGDVGRSPTNTTRTITTISNTNSHRNIDELNSSAASNSERTHARLSSLVLATQERRTSDHSIADVSTADNYTNNGSSRKFGSIGPEVILLRPTSELERDAKIAAAFGGCSNNNISRLQAEFENLELVGRDMELSAVRECLSRLQTTKTTKELVLVHGVSGTGKTTLVERAIQQPLRQQGGVFVRGKYDQERSNSRGQPFSAMAIACGELCRDILRRQEEGFCEQLGKELEENIDKPLLQLLGTIIPLLSSIISAPVDTFNDDPQSVSTIDVSRNSTTLVTPAEDPPTSFTSGPRRRHSKRFSGIVRPRTIRDEGQRADDGSRSVELSRSLCSMSTPSYRRRSSRPSHSKQLLQFALGTFLRIVASELQQHDSVVLMLLDDLQWADLPSLDMLQALAKDSTISNLMIIGCYRDEVSQIENDEAQEQQHTSVFSQCLTKLQAEHTKHVDHDDSTAGCILTAISLGNLSLESVNQIVSEVLSVSTDDAMSLAEICFNRTLGNAFFVKLFLLNLEECGMLEYRIENCRFTWDLAEVEEETAATDNVVTLLQTKLDKYPEGVLLLLQLASCLGNSFDKCTLELVWDNFLEQHQTCKHGTEASTSSSSFAPVFGQEALPRLLRFAVHEMLLVPCGHTMISEPSFSTSTTFSYRFVHNKIQESAISLILPEDFDTFRSAIGRCLLYHLEEEALENLLFLVADLLNNGFNTGQAIAELNLRAAEKAKDLSAFFSALRYVEAGIMCLNGSDDMWIDHPGLALDLHSIGAEAAECAGVTDKADWYCAQVTRQKGIAIVDKMRVSNIIVERLYSNGNYEELWRDCFDILDELGCPLPRKKSLQRFEAFLSLQQTKRLFLPDVADVNELTMIREPAKREALTFMIKAASFGLGSNNKALYILLCCRCVRWTKKYGVTSSTASAFASFANLLMHENGDWQTALKIAELAMSIEKRFGSNYTKTSTLHKTNSFVLGWIKPLRNCRVDYTSAYKLGMLSGNIEGVGMSVLFMLVCQFFSGCSLLALDEDLRKHIPHLETLKLHTYALGLRLLWQKVLNLIGANDVNPQTTSLTGTGMHGIDIEKHPFIFNTAGRHHICNLCAYFSEYEKGADIALEMGDTFYKMWSGAAYFGFEPFSRAVCLYAMAMSSTGTGGQKKYLKAARKTHATISKWVRLGAINLLHQQFLLDAEDAVVKRKERSPKKLYIKAIQTSVRGGFLGDAGIANERYALYLLSLESYDKDDAAFYMREAIRYYSEWGASRKCRLLTGQHAALLNESEVSS